VSSKIGDDGKLAPTARKLASEGLLAGVRVGVGLQRRRPGEPLAADGADVLLEGAELALGRKLVHQMRVRVHLLLVAHLHHLLRHLLAVVLRLVLLGRLRLELLLLHLLLLELLDLLDLLLELELELLHLELLLSHGLVEGLVEELARSHAHGVRVVGGGRLVLRRRVSHGHGQSVGAHGCGAGLAGGL
jgi:hypothetical protein